MIVERYQGLRFVRTYLGHREGTVTKAVPYGVAVELVRRGFAVFIDEQSQQHQQRRKRRRQRSEEE